MIVNTAAPAASNVPALITTLLSSDVVKGAFEAFTPSLVTVVTTSGYEIQVALQHNVEGFEAVVDHDGNQTALPDGPGPDATVFEVADWVERIVKAYDAAHDVHSAFQHVFDGLTKALIAWLDVRPSDAALLLDPDYPFSASLEEVQASVGAYIDRLEQRLLGQ